MEVGLSETYDELVEDARQWLEGKKEVQTVFLVKVQEALSYQCSTRHMQDDEIVAMKLPSDIDHESFSLEDETDVFSPLCIGNMVWVGRMRGFLEIWKENAMGGLAERQGDRAVSLLPFFVLIHSSIVTF